MACHSEEEWNARRELIARLYLVERLTMPEVRDYLCDSGFSVK